MWCGRARLVRAAISIAPSIREGVPAERKEIGFASPGRPATPLFRVVCDDHGEVALSPDGLCCLCSSPVDFVA